MACIFTFVIAVFFSTNNIISWLQLFILAEKEVEATALKGEEKKDIMMYYKLKRVKLRRVAVTQRHPIYGDHMCVCSSSPPGH